MTRKCLYGIEVIENDSAELYTRIFASREEFIDGYSRELDSHVADYESGDLYMHCYKIALKGEVIETFMYYGAIDRLVLCGDIVPYKKYLWREGK